MSRAGPCCKPCFSNSIFVDLSLAYQFSRCGGHGKQSPLLGRLCWAVSNNKNPTSTHQAQIQCGNLFKPYQGSEPCPKGTNKMSPQDLSKFAWYGFMARSLLLISTTVLMIQPTVMGMPETKSDSKNWFRHCFFTGFGANPAQNKWLVDDTLEGSID